VEREDGVHCARVRARVDVTLFASACCASQRTLQISPLRSGRSCYAPRGSSWRAE
jgi:hypothetical protein